LIAFSVELLFHSFVLIETLERKLLSVDFRQKQSRRALRCSIPDRPKARRYPPVFIRSCG